MSEVDRRAAPLDGNGRRPAWVGVAVMYDDGTVAAWQINDPIYGKLIMERERLDDRDDGILRRPVLSDPTLEITVRGTAGRWDRGAQSATDQLAGRKAIEPERVAGA